MNHSEVPRPFRRRLEILLPIVSVLCIALSAYVVSLYARQEIAYEHLSTHMVNDAATQRINWGALRSQNPQIVAWLNVEGTHIDYPVVQAADDVPSDWYLTHDFWDNASPMGCPYLDVRCSQDGAHLLAFGHHVSLSDQMFSDVFDAHDQGSFDTIGPATWSIPDDTTGEVVTLFQPAMAMRVDKSFTGIQVFDFISEDAMREWLSELAMHADATSKNLSALIRDATCVLTLVTCSNMRGGQRERTLVTFIAS